METLNNFSSIYCFVAFIIGAMFMLATLCIVAISKDKEPRNKEPRNNVHFYVARDKNGSLWLYIGKPVRGDNEFYGDLDRNYDEFNYCSYNFEAFGLNENDYKDLKWEDEPLEVFVNMED